MEWQPSPLTFQASEESVIEELGLAVPFTLPDGRFLDCPNTVVCEAGSTVLDPQILLVFL